MASPYNISDWYGGCHAATGATEYYLTITLHTLHTYNLNLQFTVTLTPGTLFKPTLPRVFISSIT